MFNKEIIRAWKDEDYLENLNEEKRTLLPENPAGIIELSDEDMELVAGGIDINLENNINVYNFIAGDDIVNTQIINGPGSCQDNSPA